MHWMKMRDRRDGSVRLEIIADVYREWSYALGGHWVEHADDVHDYTVAQWRVGDVGTLGESEVVDGNDVGRRTYWLDDISGIRGNMSSDQVTDGWRGTTDGVAVYAHGVRRVVSVEPRKRGHGSVIILSAGPLARPYVQEVRS